MKYRSYREEDIPGILSLWNTHSDFGAITEKNFSDWYLANPYEPCEIIIAEDNGGSVVAQMVFIPTWMYIRNKKVKALKISAPIIHNDIKFSMTDIFNNPIWKMYLEGLQYAKKNDVELLYFFPQRGWLRAFELVKSLLRKAEFATYKAFSITLTPNNAQMVSDANDLYFKPVEYFSQDYDELWEKAIHQLPVECGVIRSSQWLQYRLNAHLTIEARRKTSNELIGYCAINRSKGTLLDLFAVSPHLLYSVFQGAIDFICTTDPKKFIYDGQITGMYTPLMQSVTKNMIIGFPKYEYAFGSIITGNRISINEIRSESWYMMPDVN